ncbi:hypothetical protein ACFQ6E_38185 [Streptomyces sp. NPDC056462]|uniref:hypothetical protein n=1 Tax=Streptomyces sp. NPDC056462 TaxID=3345826 RepID=UPI0036C8A4C6
MTNGDSGRYTGDSGVAIWTPLRIRRREDQLWLDIDAGNLVPDLSEPHRPCLRRTGEQPCCLAVRFPSQHLAEEVRQQDGPRNWPVDTRRAGVSRLVFQLPDDVHSIPLTEESLLAWGDLALQVSPAALPRGAAPAGPLPIDAPTPSQTGLEVPWRTVLSPPGDSRWANATGVVTHAGRTELWHTRMASAGNDGRPDESAAPPTLRALWCTDDAFASWLAKSAEPPDGNCVPAPGLPFPMALTPRDRLQIVRATSDWSIPGYIPDPVDVERFQLSSLGASLSLRGAWSPPGAVLSLLGWQHRTALGRDHCVRVVSRGYLLPFGQPASRIRIVERTVAAESGDVRMARLQATDLLVVGHPTRNYPAFAQRFSGRALPFQRVTMETVLTPPLDTPSPLVPELGNQAFVPYVDDAPLRFAHTAADPNGREVRFDLPAVYVASDSAFVPTDMSQIRDAYHALPEKGPVRRCMLAGQVFAYAPPDRPGDTDAETHALSFALTEPLAAGDDDFIAADQPLAHPAIVSAAVRLTAVEAVTGSPVAPAEVHFYQRFLDGGFTGANKGEVFLGLVTPTDLTLPADRGALMDPGLRILALSRRLGPVGGDLDTLAAGLIDVPAMLAAAPSQPKLFGAVPLSSIVEAIQVPPPGEPVAGALLLHATTTAARPSVPHPPLAGGSLRAAAEVRPAQTRLSFEPILRSDPLGILDFTSEAYALATIVLDLDPNKTVQPDDFRLEVLILNARPWRFHTSLPDVMPDAGPAIPASQRAFTLRLFGTALNLIEVDFSKLSLTLQSGQDTKVDPDIADMRFNGVLSFVQRLRDAISGPGGAVSGNGDSRWRMIRAASLEYIEAGVSYTLPDVPLGVLTLKNIRFGASLQVPYFFVPGNRRALVLNFSFASRQDPFLIAVYVWGGGGYATISLKWPTIHLLEIGFEFGFHIELGGGAVSGSIEAMVGIYFQLESAQSGGHSVELTAYLRARGKLELFKIVSVSLELYLGLTYRSVPGRSGQLIGQARVSLTVSVLFFSVSFSYTAEHRFSGDDDKDPTFEDQMPTQALWDTYVSSFAVGR